MDTLNLREQLHEYIAIADERHLAAIYVLLENAIPEYHYDKATIEMLHQRRDNHLQGLTKSYTPEESLALIRARKK